MTTFHENILNAALEAHAALLAKAEREEERARQWRAANERLFEEARQKALARLVKELTGFDAEPDEEGRIRLSDRACFTARYAYGVTVNRPTDVPEPDDKDWQLYLVTARPGGGNDSLQAKTMEQVGRALAALDERWQKYEAEQAQAVELEAEVAARLAEQERHLAYYCGDDDKPVDPLRYVRKRTYSWVDDDMLNQMADEGWRFEIMTAPVYDPGLGDPVTLVKVSEAMPAPAEEADDDEAEEYTADDYRRMRLSRFRVKEYGWASASDLNDMIALGWAFSIASQPVYDHERHEPMTLVRIVTVPEADLESEED